MSIKLSIYDACISFTFPTYRTAYIAQHMCLPLLSINAMPCAIRIVTYIQRDPRSHKLWYIEPPRAVCLCMCTSQRRQHTFYYIVSQLGPYRPTKLYIRNQSGRRFQASNILAVSRLALVLTRNARGGRSRPRFCSETRREYIVSVFVFLFARVPYHTCAFGQISVCVVCCEYVWHRTTHE